LKTNSFKDLNLKELIYFTNELQMLLEASIPASEALGALEKNSPYINVSTFCQNLKKAVDCGANFSNTLKPYWKFLGSVYISLIKAGEESGKLPEILSYLVDYLKKQQERKEKIVSLSIYPSLLILGVIISCFIFGGFVIPKILEAFDLSKDEIPKIALFLTDSVSFFIKYWAIILISLIVGAQALLKLSSTEKIKQSFINFLLKIPYIKDCTVYFQLVHYISVLQIAYDSGVPINEALFLAKDTIISTKLRKQAENIAKYAQEGNQITEAFEKYELIPPIFKSMVATGKETGKFGEMFKNIAKGMNAKLNNSIETFLKIMPPVLLVIVGIFVGLIAYCFFQTYASALKNIF